ncbi:protein-disulfide isomerase [Kribbella orskensis]|uniref:Protein-disulfide isomerase n=1 Tax=Kribbella orskensis TaxID=2512216 RepID=A0ABY2BS37_9ACTN|nr:MULTISPECIES: thioredoxin domain-containing protein [Kribbella]TCN43225.1 protein-disulfide isomerase [Kribbella sp. VKM Ac-2500]TCO29419.1 protein-disulfide isomerase [Kribbella orskensis]
MSKTQPKPPVNPLLQQKPADLAGIVIVVVVVLAIIAAVGVDYWRKHSKVEVTTSGQPEPAVITGPGTNGKGVTVGKAGAKSHIDLYLDFRCPHCADFEEESGPTIDKLVQDGTATLTYWPLAFVSPDDSPRLANAFAAAAANGKALSYADGMYGDFSKAWTTDQLIDLGKQLGIDDQKFEAAVNDNSYQGWLDSIAQAANDRKVEGTPTVFVNDKMLSGDQLTPEGLEKAVGATS